MRRAIELARPHKTHPNPRVGAVVVDGSGLVIGEGAHLGVGDDHAEVVALRAADRAAAGSTLYVTLEPCTHQGRTPPCVEAVIEAGIRRVVVGAGDPDDRVAGSGIARLREAGVEVVEGVLTAEARELDHGYFHHRETGLPEVTLKYAMTLDGAVAAANGTSQWITSEEARMDAHRLRADADAVVVGAGTIRIDDPRLTVRIPGYDGPQPVPVVVAGTGDLPDTARIWEREPVVLSTTDRRVPSGRVVHVDGADGLPDPTSACHILSELGYLDVLVEGGARLAGEWWRAGVVSRAVVYLGAMVGGGSGISPLAGTFKTIDDAAAVSLTGVRSLGPDYRIDFELK
ncbi:MAG: bifunctional diaminohydroxyphosphoribosylaminopyrimidine deaminase/5-amino-6-(5-phosphoribosylamino)uracil reductase RibD [Actinobacteria bacterium]|nr:bifunctional diaminohydroxyphosphoribosylaminopyrimidine deaminase/5-amino-6-(5-phosphoribosylamino)uracil reductase RibD [Actinomycetota bacterium]